MCNDKLHHFLHSLPKCEHHLHIEGTISPELLFRLAAKNVVSLPQDDAAFASVSALESRYQAFTSLDDFLHYYFIAMSCLITESDFEDLTFSYLSRAHSHNVHHAEIFFDPQPHTSRGISYQTIIAGLNAARQRAQAEFPRMSVEFIPCLVRHLPVSEAHDMLAELIEFDHFADGTLIGFGMSSTEIANHPSLYTSVFEAAKAAGVTNLTAHYGEEGPAEYVRDALSLLSVGRIDHGRRSIEDPELIRALAETNTLLTLCPISNVVLKGVSHVRELPIRQLLDAGVRFSINSDDPAYFGGYILDNYCAVQEAFGFTEEEWQKIATGSIQGSWCSLERKQELMQQLDGVMHNWKYNSEGVV